MGHPLYHLESKIERCRVVVKVNDLTVAELSAEDTPEWFAPPINLYLVGDENMVEVEVWPPQLADGTFSDFANVLVEGAVRRYEKNDPVAPGEGPLVLELEVMSELAQRRADAAEHEEPLDVPQVFYFQFGSEGPDFSAELTEAEPFDDAPGLRDYAMHLRALMRAGDMNGLADEMQPKVDAYAIAYDDDRNMIDAGLREVLQNEYLPRGFETDFERDEVELVSLCGGRLWELRRPGAKPLVQTPADANGSTMQIPIVVGRRDGVLRVVR